MTILHDMHACMHGSHFNGKERNKNRDGAVDDKNSNQHITKTRAFLTLVERGGFCALVFRRSSCVLESSLRVSTFISVCVDFISVYSPNCKHLLPRNSTGTGNGVHSNVILGSVSNIFFTAKHVLICSPATKALI